MTDDLRERVLAAVRKGLAGSPDLSKTKKAVLRGYNVDSATENGVTVKASVTPPFTNEIKDVTPLHRFSANSDTQPGKLCVQCGMGGDLWIFDRPTGTVWLHEECARFLPKLEPAPPTTAYGATSADPSGTGCKVEIVELPQAQRYRKVFAFLQLQPPALVPVERWQRCVEDGSRFLAKWGDQAEALGWSSADLFGLHIPSANPHPSYSRLSRYDETGLCWLLQGRPVVALTADTAAIENKTGNITVYRRHNKPGLGPLGDSLGDLK